MAPRQALRAQCRSAVASGASVSSARAASIAALKRRRARKAGRRRGEGRASANASGAIGCASGGAGDSAPKPSSRRVRHERPARDLAFARAIGARRERQRAAQHFNEQTRERQVGPIRPRAHMKQHDQPAPARLRRDERRIVGQRRPHARFFERSGLGQHLAAHVHVGGRRDAGERASRPGTARRRAASPTRARCRASASRGAGAPAARSSASLARRGPAKRTSRPPFSSQRSSAARSVGATRPASGRIERLRARIDQFADAAALQARVRLQRAVGVEQFREQRLARAAGIDQAHERPPRARRQQAHGAGALLADDAHARGARGDLRRQFDARRRGQGAAGETHLGRAERAALRGLRRDGADRRAIRRRGAPPRSRPAASPRRRRCARAVCAGRRAVTGPRRCSSAPSASAPSSLQAVGDPDDAIEIALRLRQSLRGVGAVGPPGLRFEPADRAPSRRPPSCASPGSRARAARRGQQQEHRRAARARLASTAAMAAVARVAPERRRGPAVVDHDQRAPARALSAALGARLGRANARISSAAASARNSTSHHGARSRLCSSVRKPASRRVGGNCARCGGGGVARISHHSAGSASSADQRPGRGEQERPKAQANRSETSAISMRQRRRCAVIGAMQQRRKAELGAECADGAAMRLQPLGVNLARRFGAADQRFAPAAGLAETACGRGTESLPPPDRRSSPARRVAPAAAAACSRARQVSTGA